MRIKESVALVTGANRGLGAAVARALVDAGARTVYAGVRDTSTVADASLMPVALDVTDADQVARAAETLTDVSLVVNNAGIGVGSRLLATPLADARAELDVNYLGTVAVAQAFAPILAANGGGALVNVLSVLSLVAMPWHGTYAASKSAAWSATNSLRTELRSQGTLVMGVFAGYIDTDLTRLVDAPKLDAAEVGTAIVHAVRADQEELYVDDISRQVKAALNDDQRQLYPQIQQQYDAAA
jgi:NAD(P)-dependent dehydrogenase (short-subunit alcohol dehydrogenase family)